MRELLPLLFKKKSLIWDFDNRRFTWYEAAFYWLKTFICILFGWNVANKDMFHSNYDDIAMLAWGWYSPASWEYGGEGWDELAVGSGLFRGWYYDLYDNSTV